MNQRGQLTAGGHPVHRLQVAPGKTQAPKAPVPDAVPIRERYHDVAKMLHRTAIAPREDRFIMACTCGWAQVSGIVMGAVADIECLQHVANEAQKLHDKLELTIVEDDNV